MLYSPIKNPAHQVFISGVLVSLYANCYLSLLSSRLSTLLFDSSTLGSILAVILSFILSFIFRFCIKISFQISCILSGIVSGTGPSTHVTNIILAGIQVNTILMKNGNHSGDISHLTRQNIINRIISRTYMGIIP